MARKLVNFSGRVGAGVISIPGVEAGDKILSIVITVGSPGVDVTNSFTSFVLTDDEILQIASADNHNNTYAALLERKVML